MSTATPRTILVIDGHPNPDSLTSSLAASYADAARRAGAEVHLLTLRDLDFDPVLHQGLRGTQPLEPDLEEAQHLLTNSDHVTVFAPLWWGSTPALLKGFIDRTLESKWAYHYDKRGLPHGHLAGRSTRFVMLADSPGWYLQLLQGNPTRKQMVRSTLKFCGFSPVRFTRFSPVRTSTADKRAAWHIQIADIAEKDATDSRKSAKSKADPFAIREGLMKERATTS